METTELEMNLGHLFIEKNLLERALTTNGWVNEHKQDFEHIKSQEAFSTLGDAVLKLILVDKLVAKGIEDCGIITEDKKKAENRRILSEISRKSMLVFRYLYLPLRLMFTLLLKLCRWQINVRCSISKGLRLHLKIYRNRRCENIVLQFTQL